MHNEPLAKEAYRNSMEKLAEANKRIASGREALEEKRRQLETLKAEKVLLMEELSRLSFLAFGRKKELRAVIAEKNTALARAQAEVSATELSLENCISAAHAASVESEQLLLQWQAQDEPVTIGSQSPETEEQTSGSREPTPDELLPVSIQRSEETAEETSAAELQPSEETEPEPEIMDAPGSTAIELLGTEEGRALLIRYLNALEQPVLLEELKLNTRPYNSLRRGHMSTVAEALQLYPDGYIDLPYAGAKSAAEIKEAIESFLSARMQEILQFRDTGAVPAAPYTETEETAEIILPAPTDDTATAALGLLSMEEGRGMLAAYFEQYACIPVERMGLSVRSTNALLRAGLNTLPEIARIYPEYGTIRNMGAGSVKEVTDYVRSAVMEHSAAFMEYATGRGTAPSAKAGDPLALLSKIIYDGFGGAGFESLTQDEVSRFCFPDTPKEQIEAVLAALVTEGKLLYEEGTYSRKYPTFTDALQASAKLTEDEKNIVSRTLAGETLEAVGSTYGLTRERIRQKQARALEKLRTENMQNTGADCFEEDRYRFLYTHYVTDREFWTDFMHVSAQTDRYLSFYYKKEKGALLLEEALQDEDIPVQLKRNIQAYLNRDSILLDGIPVEKTRGAVESYVLKTYARDEITFERFCDIYNRVLENSGIPAGDSIFYTPEMRTTRTNKLMTSHDCLWKQGARLRYYDIQAHDFSLLLEVLHLDTYRNTELSTQKFMEEYPELMKSYDIRDKNELHNILKVIVPEGSLNDISYPRQPTVRFGQFDRGAAFYDIMAELAPVSSKELAAAIHKQYGFDEATVMNPRELSVYFHNGMYAVDFTRMPEERAKALREMLTEPFYYLEEIRAVYDTLFPDADPAEVNPHTLKQLGFSVFQGYAVQNYQTAYAYFKDILLREDRFSLTDLNRRYGNIQMYRQTVQEMMQSYDIIEYAHGECLSVRKLEKDGVTKEMLRTFCDTVAAYVQDGEFFTVCSLRNRGLLPDIPNCPAQEDAFYACLLFADSRFRKQSLFHTPVLVKHFSGCICTEDVLGTFLKREVPIKAGEFIRQCRAEYGINIPSVSEVKFIATTAGLKYDDLSGSIST